MESLRVSRSDPSWDVLLGSLEVNSQEKSD